MSAASPYTQQVSQYKKNAVETASPEEILIMLYDGAIRFLLLARKSLTQKDWEKYNRNLISAQKIVLELRNTLDRDAEGDVIKNLLALYEYFHYRLVQANLHHNDEMVVEVLTHLRSFRQTWQEAIVIARRERETSLSPQRA